MRSRFSVRPSDLPAAVIHNPSHTGVSISVLTVLPYSEGALKHVLVGLVHLFHPFFTISVYDIDEV